MQTIRTFIALSASADIQQKIIPIQSELIAANADVKWETQDKFHITLKFLGDIDTARIESISTLLANAVKTIPTSDIIYQSIGAFPNLHNPRVIWIGIAPNQVVLDLQSKIEQICVGLGFIKKDRPFHPHITLGRVKGNGNLVRLTEAIKTITFEPIRSCCTEVLLMKSDLRAGGSIYTTLKSFSLQT